MSLAGDMDADKQALAKFDHYSDLPAELRIKVIHEFLADFRKQTVPGKLAPFAGGLHSEWQHEVEAEEKLFGSLYLTTDDLPTLLLWLNQRRRDSLSKIALLIWITNASIQPSGEGHEDTGKATVFLRTKDFVVQSVGRILKSLDSGEHAVSQSTKPGIELEIQIMIPLDHDNLSLHKHFPHQAVDCDFSQLPPTNAIRTLVQGPFGQLDVQKRSRRGDLSPARRHLYLTPSSSLSLASRMSNLEHANIRSTSMEHKFIRSTSIFGAGVTITPQFNTCPTLKTLRVGETVGAPLLPSVLVPWTSSWSERIEHLHIDDVWYIADFLRTFPTVGHTSGITAWTNLQVLSLGGCYYPLAMPSPLNAGGGQNLADILSAMAVALVSLPSIREVCIKLIYLDRRFPDIKIKLRLCSGSSELTVSDECYRLPVSKNIRKFWTIFFEDTIRPAVAAVQAAAWKHHGLALEVVLPKQDDEPATE